ncbi:MAG: ATP-binding protein [Oligoflexus sp.]
MAKKRQRSLSYKLLAGVFLGSSIITFFVTLVHLYWDYRVELDRLTKTLTHVQDLYLPGVTQSLWDLNDDHVILNLEGITQLNDIAYASIESEGVIQYQAGEMLVGDFRSMEFDISYQRGDHIYHLGRLKVMASLEGIYKRLQDKVLVVFASYFVKALILTGFMLALFYHLVTKHLLAIASFLKKLNFDSQPANIQLARHTNTRDELDLVTDSINRLTEKIHEQLQLRIEAENRLLVLNSTLEKEVKRRTKENEEQQLLIQHSARLSSLGEMAGSIAHEINNPLTIISGYVAMLRKHMTTGGISPEKLNYIGGRIELTIERITAIIKGLLRLSRDDSMDSFNVHAINSIVDDAVAICKEKFISRGISFECHIPEEQLLVYCRPIEIGQVIINLLNNAFDEVKGDAKPWIRVNLEAKSENVEIAVSDSGRGIPVDIRSKILEPFFTTKPQGEGTGLGLSISRAITSKHQGKLFLDESATYTRFVIQLPSVRDEEASKPTTSTRLHDYNQAAAASFGNRNYKE